MLFLPLFIFYFILLLLLFLNAYSQNDETGVVEVLEIKFFFLINHGGNFFT